MGIENFCKLIDPLLPPESTPQSFDSILVDVQSFLYVAIEYSLQHDEEAMIHDICKLTWRQLLKTLDALLEPQVHNAHSMTLVLSFDGEGVPMKWPTQRQRRSHLLNIKRKDAFRFALFGCNKITLRVEDYILSQLKKRFKLPCSEVDVILCGCRVPGEGEHKMFHVAESVSCRNPIVVSVDQDVFVLAFSRIDRYESLQIFRYQKFYNVNRFLNKSLQYDPSRFLAVSNLFGNDFIPALVGITPINAPTIHNSITPDDEDQNDEAEIIANFISNMKKYIRFEKTPHVDQSLIEAYWLTHLWIKDYYTKRNFKQKFIKNPIFDSFDRNQLLTGLSNAAYSLKVKQDVMKMYENLDTETVEDQTHRSEVFSSETARNTLEKFWRNLNKEDQFCQRLHLKKHC